MSKQKPLPRTSEPIQEDQAKRLPADLIAQLRAAATVTEAVQILQPDARPKAKVDAVYEVNAACPEPLPQKRGLALLVYVTAARINAPFRTSDIETALPDRKSVRYWVRRLATTGHFAEVVS